jgi:hypothetical protein
MDTLPLPLPTPRTLTVFYAPGSCYEPVTQLLAELALLGPVMVLDGGNHFPAYHLLRLLRLQSPDPASIARRIYVRRAFTCYQMLALLEGTQPLPQPCILLDPLSTFYDEQVKVTEITRLLEGCLRQIGRLRQVAPVLVTVSPAHTPERAFLVERICNCSDALYSLEFFSPQVLQPVLF